MKKEAIQNAIEEYNKYRSPRATVKLLNYSKKEIEVEIKGTFCRSCGMEDYFIDLVYELEREGINAELLGFEKVEDERFTATYREEITG